MTRWASVAFGAGVGIGSAYIESSYIFGGSLAKWSAPEVSAIPPTTHISAIPPTHVRPLCAFIFYALLNNMQ